MGKLVGPPIAAEDCEWIAKQRIFFHATAPLSANHQVNVSPKSSKEFRVIDDQTVCWLDLSGSGSETAAHILQNGRLTIMFVALEGPPRIMRLHGKGRLVLPQELMHPSALQNNELCRLRQLFEGELPGQQNHDYGFRSIVILDVKRVTHSCGYSIPTYAFQEDRPILKNFTAHKGCEGMIAYRALKNSFSIDGLPSIGQLERGELPSSVNSSTGYYLAEYGGSWLGKMRVWVEMLWRKGLPPSAWRDVLFFCSGGLVSTMLLQLLVLKKIRGEK